MAHEYVKNKYHQTVECLKFIKHDRNRIYKFTLWINSIQFRESNFHLILSKVKVELIINITIYLLHVCEKLTVSELFMVYNVLIIT